MSMNIPQAIADLLNKTETGWVVFMHTVPSRIFRVVHNDECKTFRVEQFTRTNKDNFNPQGTWHTVSTHGGETPWGACQAACAAACQSQREFVGKLSSRMEKQVQRQVKRFQQG